jgi:hypothetical protein
VRVARPADGSGQSCWLRCSCARWRLRWWELRRFLLHNRGRLAGPTGRCGTKECPRRRMLLYAHLARHSSRGPCGPVRSDLSPSITPRPSRSPAHPTLTSHFASCALLHLVHNEAIRTGSRSGCGHTWRPRRLLLLLMDPRSPFSRGQASRERGMGSLRTIAA